MTWIIVFPLLFLDNFLQECSEQESGDSRENVLNIIDAFTVPRFTYSVDRKKFLPDDLINAGQPKIYAGT